MRVLLLASLVSGCGTVPQVVIGKQTTAATSDGVIVANPSGTCVESGGPRHGYVPGPDDRWLPDCANPLAREYWRIYLQPSGTVYVTPRPDASADRYANACTDAADPLHAVLERYEMCGAIGSSQVEKINAMSPPDALMITRYLHESLRFELVGKSYSPYALPSDIIDACGLHANGPELQAICDREQRQIESGAGLGYYYEGQGALELAARLNELYAID